MRRKSDTIILKLRITGKTLITTWIVSVRIITFGGSATTMGKFHKIQTIPRSLGHGRAKTTQIQEMLRILLTRASITTQMSTYHCCPAGNNPKT